MGFFDVSRLRVGTLGASGSLMAIVGTSTVIYPEMPVGFMFIPFVSFPLKYIMVGLVAFDVTGIAARWQTFDHAAHVSLLFHGLR
jgi:membrane associated rhomboid family serine protease